VSPDDLQKAANEIDSISKLIRKDSITFSEGAAKFSDDKNTKYNGGVIANPQTGQTKWEMDQVGQMDPSLPFTLNNLNVGDISSALQYATPDGKQGYRIVMLRNRTKPHKANLTDDYQLIQSQALAKKQAEAVSTWINRKIKEGVYVHVDDSFKDCAFQNHWFSTP
jgi:peptidyl-prolyl cis-trans isomerase SurA